MTASPKISVIMPVARVDCYLETTLESIEAQTFRDFELVLVCDPGISDEIKQIAGQARFAFPKRVISTRLAGFAFAVNLGIAQSTGELIARWDADDLCDPNRFERQLQEFARRPDLGVLGTRAQLIDGNGDLIPSHGFKFYETDVQIRAALKYRQPLLHTSLMFRASVLFDHKGYRYGYTSEDHELFIRIARDKAVKFGNLPDVVSYYRRHADQLTSTARQYDQFCDISGFMMTEFLRTGNPMYIIGSLANLPIARQSRQFIRAVKRTLSHAH